MTMNNLLGMSGSEWKSLGWTLVALLFVRAFVAEPYKIPSGSMIPTLLIGDHILVSKSSYDLRIPFTDTQFLKVADPRRGDVVVFKYPNYEQDPTKEGIFFIKRLIGLPGDKISIRKGVITINGSTSPLRELSNTGEFPSQTPQYRLNTGSVALFEEQLPGMNKTHLLQHYKSDLSMLDDAIATWQSLSGRDCAEVGKAYLGRQYVYDSRMMNSICEFVVPAGHYFFMGDNRDDSSDGRFWGFVPRHYIKGKALFIWLPFKSEGPGSSWDYTMASGDGEGGPFLRWSRLGLRIQ